MSFKKSVPIAMVALVATVSLVACGGDDDTTTAGTTTSAETTAAPTETTPPPKPAIETIVVRDGKPVGGLQELEFDAGDRIRFRVRSNVADEVHVHGYDVSEEVPADGSALFSFPADIEGIFEVELHHSGEQIAELRVNP